ncbi:TPA: M-like protein SzM, partial [Streptococcus equi subsp. zooepidemicus]|nr:M-like protein SzM [Streptococcus equi subsp. zooepidemicus]
MFLRNNKQKFSIRKLSAGAASVLVAVSVLGGAAVKADTGTGVNRSFETLLKGKNVSNETSSRLVNVIAELEATQWRDTDSALKKLREILSDASVETIQALMRGLDSARTITYGNDRANWFYRKLNTLGNDRPNDVYRSRGLNLYSLLIDEV